MWGLLGKIFGSDKVIEKAGDLIDDVFYTDSEEAADKKEMAKFKADHRIKLMDAYAPFKVAQRFIAFGFVFVFLFIMLNGVLGALYGWVPMVNVNNARDFADKMWLGEIIVMIVSFYFGGGLAESIKRKPEGK
jgi:hypothetical protein